MEGSGRGYCFPQRYERKSRSSLSLRSERNRWPHFADVFPGPWNSFANQKSRYLLRIHCRDDQSLCLKNASDLHIDHFQWNWYVPSAPAHSVIENALVWGFWACNIRRLGVQTQAMHLHHVWLPGTIVRFPHTVEVDWARFQLQRLWWGRKRVGMTMGCTSAEKPVTARDIFSAHWEMEMRFIEQSIDTKEL